VGEGAAMKLYVTEVKADCSVRIHEAEAIESDNGYRVSARQIMFGDLNWLSKDDLWLLCIATTRREALRLRAEELHRQWVRLKNQEGMIKQTLDAIVALERE